MPETWYILDDDSLGDPHEVARDDKGVLRHKDGRAVAHASHGPRTRSVDAEAERARSAGRVKAGEDAKKAADKSSDKEKEPQARTREMKPNEQGLSYKTR